MPGSPAPTYSIVTTCKGRLDDLKRSLRRFAAQRDAQVVVVDYDCPQGTAAYVRRAHPEVAVVQVADRPAFNGPDARNRGAAAATGKILAFLDADVIVAEDFLERARFPRQGRAFAAFADGAGDSLRGSCLVRAADFAEVGGYDELLTGYGGEDLDLYRRLGFLGARRIALDPGLVERTLEQSTEERLRFRGPDAVRQFLRGQLYQLAKEMVMRAQGLLRLELAAREALMAEVDRQLDALVTGASDFQMTVNLPDRYSRGMLSDWEFSTAVTVRARKKAPA